MDLTPNLLLLANLHQASCSSSPRTPNRNRSFIYIWCMEGSHLSQMHLTDNFPARECVNIPAWKVSPDPETQP
jgi:hypothetical protein